MKIFPIKNEQNVLYFSSIYSLKFVKSEIVPLWLKNRNQRIHMGGLIWGAYTRGGGGGGGLQVEIYRVPQDREG